MNKIKLLTFLFATLIISTLTSCDKDDEDKEPSRTALLTDPTWQGNRAFIDGQDVTSFIDIDNTSFKFKTDGKYDVVLSGTPENGTWEFTNNEQKLLLDKGTNSELIVDILKLTDSNLDLKWTEEDEDTGETYTVELRFIKK